MHAPRSQDEPPLPGAPVSGVSPSAVRMSRGGRVLGTLVALLVVGALAFSAWWLVQRNGSGAGERAASGPGAGARPSASAQAPAQGGRGAGAQAGAATAGGASAAASGSGQRSAAGSAQGGGPTAAASSRPPGGGGSSLPTVGVALAQAGELPVVVEALGTVTPVTTVVLRPQVTGVLIEVLFTEGQSVKKGELLARIDPAPFEQALAQMRAAKARNEAQLNAARVTLERYRTLWKQDSIARQDVDTQAALVRQLEASVQADRANEQAAALNLGYTRLTAPISGRIGLRAVDPGNMVAAGAAAGIATITQMAPIDVQFSVPQDRVPEILSAQRGKSSMSVQVLDRGREDILATGGFSTLDNVVDVATGTVRAKARFDNEDQSLFPSQFVNVRLLVGAARGILVPVAAVRTGPNGDYVYVVDSERTVHMRAVERGASSHDATQLAKGLQGGEQVVVEGGDRVKDGARVQIAGGVQGEPRAARR